MEGDDLSSTEQNAGSRLEVDEATFQEVLALLKRLQANERMLEVNGGYDKVTIDSQESFHDNPDGPAYVGYKMSIYGYNREKVKGNKFTLTCHLFVQYSLVPSVTWSKNEAGVKVKKIKWYLNVGCNPSLMTGADDLNQVVGIPPDFELLRGGSPTGENALIVFHTLGYWWLEEASKRLLRDSKELKFKWNDYYFDKILDGEVLLNEVSFSFLGGKVTAAQLHKLLVKLEVVYGNTMIINSGDRHGSPRTVNVGDLLGVHFEKKPYRRKGAEGEKEGGPQSTAFKYTRDPIELTTKCGAHVLVKLRVDHKVHRERTMDSGGEEVARRVARIRYTVTLTNRFLIEKRYIAADDETGRREYRPFTLKDFVTLCVSNSRNTDEDDYFRMHYEYAIILFNEVMYKDLMFSQIVSFDPDKILNALHEWSKSNKKRREFLATWESNIGSERESIPKMARRLGMSEKVLREYKQQLEKLGVDLRLPLPVYYLLIRAMADADPTIKQLIGKMHEDLETTGVFVDGGYAPGSVEYKRYKTLFKNVMALNFADMSIFQKTPEILDKLFPASRLKALK